MSPPLQRRAAPVLLLVGLGALSSIAFGCGGALPSSFEALGVPTVEPGEGEAAIVVGWAAEERAGWTIRSIRVDDRAVREWDAETQRPAVIVVSPGRRSLRLSTAQLRDPGERGGSFRRRYRLRPLTIEIAEGESQICVARIGGRRQRPGLRCSSNLRGERRPSTDGEPAESRRRGEESYGREVSAVDEARRPAPAPHEPPHASLPGRWLEVSAGEGTTADDGSSELVPAPYARSTSMVTRIEGLEARLERIEHHLLRLLQSVGLPVDGVDEGGRSEHSGEGRGQDRPLDIDTRPPW